MTDQNNAAQAATQEIHEAFELSYAMDCDDLANASDLSHFTNGWRACIMSQVRAEGVQAGDERERGYAENAAFRVWWDENQACPEHSLTTENAAHAAWQERGRRAALASAPVAGEAQPTDADITNTIRALLDQARHARHADGEMGVRVQDVMIARAVLARYGHTPLPLTDAAPQASEAVPQAVIDALKGWTGAEPSQAVLARAVDAWLDPGAVWESEQTQADKDGGDCAKGTSDHENMREVLQWIVDDAASGGVAKLRPQQEKRARAALSPTQPTEQGERDE